MNQKPSTLATHWSTTPLARILGPMQEFINQSQSGGIVLLVMTVVALAIANSPLSASYLAVLDTRIGITAGPLVLEESALQGPISLLSIDIEGHELPALRSLDLARWQPELVCLEVATADGKRSVDAVAHLQANGYEIALDLGLNLVLRRGPGQH